MGGRGGYSLWSHNFRIGKKTHFTQFSTGTTAARKTGGGGTPNKRGGYLESRECGVLHDKKRRKLRKL